MSTILSSFPSHAYRCLDGTDVYHIRHDCKNLELMVSHTKNDEWYGDYLNSDGWHDLSADDAKLAAEAYGCLDIHLRDYSGEGKVQIIDFEVYRPDPDKFNKFYYGD